MNSEYLHSTVSLHAASMKPLKWILLNIAVTLLNTVLNLLYACNITSYMCISYICSYPVTVRYVATTEAHTLSVDFTQNSG